MAYKIYYKVLKCFYLVLGTYLVLKKKRFKNKHNILI